MIDGLFKDDQSLLLSDSNVSDPSLPLTIDSETLRKYEISLIKLLSKPRSWRGFIRVVTNEFKRLGFPDWIYFRLDVPPQLAARYQLGSMAYSDTVIKDCKPYYDTDFISRHLLVSDKIIQQSDVCRFLDSPFCPDGKIFDDNRRMYQITVSGNFSPLIATNPLADSSSHEYPQAPYTKVAEIQNLECSCKQAIE